MNYTTTTNTSLIVCSCPLFATLLVRLVYRHSSRINMIQLLGSLLAFVGMIIVVLNGRFVLHLSPVGDALAFTACMSWAVYSLLDEIGIGRLWRSFYYPQGLLLWCAYHLALLSYYPWVAGMGCVYEASVVGNLLFLGCLASMICFLTWNWCISKLGAVKATNWVYFNPITTMIFASLVLDEKITPYFLAGACCILAGMYIADKMTKAE